MGTISKILNIRIIISFNSLISLSLLLTFNSRNGSALYKGAGDRHPSACFLVDVRNRLRKKPALGEPVPVPHVNG